MGTGACGKKQKGTTPGNMSTTSTAQDSQVGGSHYLKYIMRYRDKNGLKDLEKAAHCLKLCQEYYAGGYRWKRDCKQKWHVAPVLFCRMNQLEELQTRLILRIANIRHIPGVDTPPNWDGMQALLEKMMFKLVNEKAAPVHLGAACGATAVVLLTEQ